MHRKPLEGIHSLLFFLGGLAGYALHAQAYTWWVVLIALVVLSVAAGSLVEFLNKMNKKVQ